MTRRGPPRIARAIIRAVTEPAERSWLLADLDDLYDARRAQRGRVRADLWFVSQVARSIPPLLARRVRADRAPLHPNDPHTMGFEDSSSRPFAAVAYLARHAIRRLIREPAFTAGAALTLALGVGSSVAVFAVVEAVLLRPLPYPSADRLVTINHRDTRTGIAKEFVAVGDAVDILARQSSFDVIGAYGFGGQVTVTSAPEPYLASLLQVAPAVLASLGFRPTIGRAFDKSDEHDGPSTSVIVGWDLWQNKLGGDPRVVGTSIKLGRQAITIVGVAPRGFRLRNLQPADLIVPTTLPIQAPAQRKAGWAFLLARLKPDRTLDGAQADLARISHQLEKEFPTSNLSSKYFAIPLRDVLAGNTKTPLMLLLAAVALVMLIACANVANLLLARSLARRREMAVRLALGAGRGRLAAQLLAENLALALLAAGIGVALSHWGAKALVVLVPQSVVAPGLADVKIDGTVLGFALAATVLTTLVFGLVAMVTVRLDSAASVLVAGGRASASGMMRRLASGLVVVEVALAITLLVGAGLILRTFGALLSIDPGFRYDHVVTMTTTLPADRYRDTVAREGFYRAADQALHAVPGVRDVGTAAVTPLTGNNWTVGFLRADQPLPAGERPPEVGWQVASSGFFRVLSIPLLSGRLFDDRDRPGGPRAVIVSSSIEKRYFPNERAVGKLLKEGTGPGAETMQIVGVVGDIRRAGLRDDPRADMYFPAEQSPDQETTLFVRVSGDPSLAAPSLQTALRSIEPRIAITHVKSLADVAAESVRTTKLVLWLLGAFAIVAVLLAAIGIYGVMSYVVRQRTREIGTRMALGATPRGIVLLIMREGAAIACLGAAIGLGLGVVATRSLGSLLYGVSAWDPLTMAGATLVLVGAILAACFIPARRAAAVDPARTLAEQ